MASKAHPAAPLRRSKVRLSHLVAGSDIGSIAAVPAPPNIAVQIYDQATMTKMIAHSRGAANRPTRRSPGGRRTRKVYARSTKFYASSGERSNLAENFL
jgi:hypothetical protein